MESKRKILYVDDEAINLQMFKILFKKSYTVITAEDGLIALNLLETNHDIAAVISDMKMPYMTGIEFITIAKQKYAHLKYFILSGFDLTEEVKQALDSGLILQYFNKPFEINEIQKALTKSLTEL